MRRRVSFCGRTAILCSAGALAASVDTPARAVDRYYLGPGSGAGAVWNVPGNWNTSPFGGGAIGVPGPTDIARHTAASATDRIVTLNAFINVLELHLSNTGGGVNAFTQTLGVDVTAGLEIVGNGGMGAHTQTAGINTYTQLRIGASSNLSFTGTYTLGGAGAVRVPSAGGELRVGETGIGTFDQTGGTVTVGGVGAATPLYLGYNSGASGTYNLSGSGQLTTHGNVYVGYNVLATGTASGTFAQTGGTHTSSGSILIGSRNGSTGSYSLGGIGSLSSQTVHVGRNDSATGSVSGTFTQTGGTHAAATLYIGSNQSGGIASGSYNLSGPGSLTVSGDERIGFNTTGASATTGTFTQSAGNHSAGNLYLGSGAGVSGAYVMTGGQLHVDATLGVGSNSTGSEGNGTFNHSGGTVVVDGDGIIGGFTAAGSYNLSGTASLSVRALSVNGSFTQSGGSSVIGLGAPADMTAGLGTGVAGTYTLSGGSATVYGVGLFGGDGALIQHTGGTLTILPGTGNGVVGSLFALAPYVGGAATYNLSGAGTLALEVPAHIGGIAYNDASAPGEAGILNIGGGGTMTVDDTLTIYDSPGTSLNLSAGGTLTARSILGAFSRLNWTGGALAVTDPATNVAIGPQGMFQHLTLAPGMSFTAATVTVESGGTLTRNGGALESDTLILAGGTIDGSSPLANAGRLAGSGTIGGSGGFTNTGVISVGSGILTIANTAANANAGTIDLAPAAQLHLTGANLANTGTIHFGGGAGGIGMGGTVRITGTAALHNLGGGFIVGAGTISAPLVNGPGGTILVQADTLDLTQPTANAGTIELDGSGARLRGGAITNHGLLTGRGLISNGLTNATAGEIRAEAGKRLTIGSMVGANAGTITLETGTAEFLGALTNGPTGLVRGRGILRANGGLINNGQVQLVGGVSDVHGAVIANDGSKIIVTGAGAAGFYDPLTLNSGSEFRVSAGATAVFFDSVTGPGAFTGSGTKIFESGHSSLSSVATFGHAVIGTAATVTADHFSDGALTVSGLATVRARTSGGGTSVLYDLSVIDGGKLDIADNILVLSGAVAGTWDGSNYTGVTGLLQSGRNNGAWNGSGIITSLPAAGGGLTTLAIATAAQMGVEQFSGIGVTSDDVLLMYSYAGDATLDGTINIDDYGRIDANIAQSGAVFGWYNGDFNYDGAINIDDYGIIDGNISNQGTPFPTSGSGALAAGEGAGMSAVPEPVAGLVLAAAGMLQSLPRRRRTK